MLRRIFVGCAVLIAGVIFAAPSVAAPAPGLRMLPCARTTIASRKLPVGPAEYESGRLTLANGTSMRLQGTQAEMYRVSEMANRDPVVACYGPLKRYADAPPSRAITVLDLSNGAYYGTLIGTWKQH